MRNIQRAKHIVMLIKSGELSRANEMLKSSDLGSNTTRVLLTTIYHANEINKKRLAEIQAEQINKRKRIKYKRLQGAVKLSQWS